MNVREQIGRRIALLSVAALLVPLFVFPTQFGLQLTTAIAGNLFYELVFYGLVVFLMHRQGSLLKLVQAAALCLVYRLAVGALLGLTVAGLYMMDMTVSLTLGMFAYLPAIIFHAVVTPAIMKPVIDMLYPVPESISGNLPAASNNDRKRDAVPTASMASIAVSKKSGPVVDRVAPLTAKRPVKVAAVSGARLEAPAVSTETNGFERAVRYIGENGSVNLAAVVDHEGLSLATFARGEVDAELWIPLSLILMESNEATLCRGQAGRPEKLDISTADKKVVVAAGEGCHLLVVAERQADEVLSIRINQGLEMISRYVTERYGESLNPSAERTHVPSA